MTYLLWFLLALATLLPLVTYYVYYHRRLGTRRKQLLQTLLSLSLCDEYMLMRHGEKYGEWKSREPESKRLAEFEGMYFDEDFRAGHSHRDYAWPVALFAALSGVGWMLTLHRLPGGLAFLGDVSAIFPPALAYGFVGAYLACVLSLFDGFRRYDLDPSLYYSVSFRVAFSGLAAYVIGTAVVASLTPLVAFGIGLFPLEQTWNFVTDKAAKAVGAARPEGEVGAELANIQGLEHQRNRQRLIDVGVTTIQGLATADPLWLFFNTTFPLRTVVDLIDKAILNLYLGKEKMDVLRTHGINGVIELVAVAKLAEKSPAYKGKLGADRAEPLVGLFDGIDVDELIKSVGGVLGQTPDELKAFIYNMYYDPMVTFIYDIWGRYLNRPVERLLAEHPAGQSLTQPAAPQAAPQNGPQTAPELAPAGATG